MAERSRGMAARRPQIVLLLLLLSTTLQVQLCAGFFQFQPAATSAKSPAAAVSVTVDDILDLKSKKTTSDLGQSVEEEEVLPNPEAHRAGGGGDDSDDVQGRQRQDRRFGEGTIDDRRIF